MNFLKYRFITGCCTELQVTHIMVTRVVEIEMIIINIQHNTISYLLEALWVIPYQFTKLLHMTLSELNEIWCVGSSSGLMYPKGISPKLLVWLPRNALLNIFSFCSFAMHIFIQSIIT